MSGKEALKMKNKCNWNRVYKRTEKDITKNVPPDFSGVPDLMLLRRARTLDRMAFVIAIVAGVIMFAVMMSYLIATHIDFDFFVGFAFIIILIDSAVLVCAGVIGARFEVSSNECIHEFQRRNSDWKESSCNDIRKSYYQIVAEMSDPSHDETHESIPMSAWKEQ